MSILKGSIIIGVILTVAQMRFHAISGKRNLLGLQERFLIPPLAGQTGRLPNMK